MKYEEELFDAVLDGDIEIAKELIAKGADIHEITPSESWTYFHHVFKSLSEKAPIESVHFLLEQKLNVNAIDCYGNTPLLYAVRQRNVEAIRLLLQNGAADFIEHENLDNVSALRMAFIQKPSLCCEGVKLLLDSGASPDKKNKNGKTVRERLEIIVGVPDDVQALIAKY